MTTGPDICGKRTRLTLTAEGVVFNGHVFHDHITTTQLLASMLPNERRSDRVRNFHEDQVRGLRNRQKTRKRREKSGTQNPADKKNSAPSIDRVNRTFSEYAATIARNLD